MLSSSLERHTGNGRMDCMNSDLRHRVPFRRVSPYGFFMQYLHDIYY
jgi:hypothetical protein